MIFYVGIITWGGATASRAVPKLTSWRSRKASCSRRCTLSGHGGAYVLGCMNAVDGTEFDALFDEYARHRTSDRSSASFPSLRYCSPSRSALMSGRFPLHVNQGNPRCVGPAGGVDLRMKLLPEKLKKQGYKTAIVGERV